MAGGGWPRWDHPASGHLKLQQLLAVREGGRREGGRKPSDPDSKVPQGRECGCKL